MAYRHVIARTTFPFPCGTDDFVDLVFLPKPSPGKIRKTSVMLHSGATEGD